MPQPDLFSTYPQSPGWKKTDTSLAAAKAVAPRAGTLRERVRHALETAGPATSVQIAAYLGEPYESISPRLSELRAKNQVIDTGKRGPSRDPTKQAIVWRVATEADVAKTQGKE